MKVAIISLVALALAGLVYIRLAPSNAADWHKRPGNSIMGHNALKDGHIFREAVPGDGRETLANLDRIIRGMPRTTVLAGSMDDGKITYVTRSKVIGFPDYTTVSIVEENGESILEIWGRLRFGASDLGVNPARIQRWLDALGQS